MISSCPRFINVLIACGKKKEHEYICGGSRMRRTRSDMSFINSFVKHLQPEKLVYPRRGWEGAQCLVSARVGEVAF